MNVRQPSTARLWISIGASFAIVISGGMLASYSAWGYVRAADAATFAGQYCFEGHEVAGC